MRLLDRPVRVRHLLQAAAAVVVAGIAVALAGVVNLAASSGHWRITDWVLHGIMQRSIATYSIAVEDPPRLGDPRLVRRGAGHYERGCAFCHGSPAAGAPALAAQMTPAPPTLEGSAQKWTERELFRIVQHGVKLTGMPAWIAPERHDEVWAMVAFLEALPGMDAAAYRDLALGEADGTAEGERAVEVGPDGAAADKTGDAPFDAALRGCAACHGVDGRGHGGAFPILAGQSRAYLAESLRAYGEGRRPSGIMQLAVDGLDAATLDRLAGHYAAEPPPAPAGAAEDTGAPAFGEGPTPDEIERGREIAARGVPAAYVPACSGCHDGGAANPVFPRLTGQRQDYLEAQLKLWRDGDRGGTPYSDLMRIVAQRLDDADIAAVAAYYAGTPPVTPR